MTDSFNLQPDLRADEEEQEDRPGEIAGRTEDEWIELLRPYLHDEADYYARALFDEKLQRERERREGRS